MEEWIGWTVNLLLFIALSVTTLAVVGLYRFESDFMRLHAASKAAFIGVAPLLVAVGLVGDAPMIGRALLVGIALFVVIPLAGFAIGRAVFLGTREPGKPEEK